MNVRIPSSNLSDRSFSQLCIIFCIIKIFPFEHRVSVKIKAGPSSRVRTRDRDLETATIEIFDIREHRSPESVLRGVATPRRSPQRVAQRKTKGSPRLLVNLSAETARAVVSRTAR